jgi:hypothetical protein
VRIRYLDVKRVLWRFGPLPWSRGGLQQVVAILFPTTYRPAPALDTIITGATSLAGHNLICGMSAVGSCADNAAAEDLFGMLKRERVNRRRYQTRGEAGADIFDYIECFHNPRRRRQLEMLYEKDLLLTKPSVETG